MCRHDTHFLLLDPLSVPSSGSLKPRACQAGGGIFRQKEPKQLGLGARGGPAACGVAGAEDKGDSAELARNRVSEGGSAVTHSPGARLGRGVYWAHTLELSWELEIQTFILPDKRK